jgi:hypothetical protein
VPWNKEDLYKKRNGTSAFVTICTPASRAALLIADETDPIPPSTYLQVYFLSNKRFSENEKGKIN